LASVIETSEPFGLPSSSGFTVTATWSPGLSNSFFQPVRAIMFGLPHSTPHSVLSPFASCTSS